MLGKFTTKLDIPLITPNRVVLKSFILGDTIEENLLSEGPFTIRLNPTMKFFLLLFLTKFIINFD